MKKSLVLFGVVLVAGLLVFGCLTPPVQKPAPAGKNCDYSAECFVGAFNNSCEKAYGNLSFPEQGAQVYLALTGMENGKCGAYLQLVRANDVPEMLYGLDAKCRVTEAELLAMGQSFELEKLDCTGPLYEAVKTAKAMGLLGTK